MNSKEIVDFTVAAISTPEILELAKKIAAQRARAESGFRKKWWQFWR